MKNLMNDLIENGLYQKYVFPVIARFLKSISPPTTTNNTELRQHLLALQNRFQGALHFLTNHSICKEGKNISLQELPWYLVMGTPDAGKSSLLANSSIHYLLGKSSQQESHKTIPTSESCDWWATRDAVLVDIPGHYTSLPNKGNDLLFNKLWRHFLDLIKSSNKHCLLNGVIFTLCLSDIIDKTQHDKIMRHLKYNIGLLLSQFGNNLSFYFVINKCDLLPGFTDFFAESSADELAQPFGITLPTLSSFITLPTTVTQRFDALIGRLNKQLIWRLHQENQLIIKSHIKDFPLQVERLKNSLIDFLTPVSRFLPAFNLKGIYLTSASQQPNTDPLTISYPQVVEANEFQQALAIMREPESPTRAYFIKHFLLHGLVPSIHAEYIHSKQNKFRLIYSIIALTLAVLGLTWFKHH